MMVKIYDGANAEHCDVCLVVREASGHKSVQDSLNEVISL
jgi:hypothetical protein